MPLDTPNQLESKFVQIGDIIASLESRLSPVLTQPMVDSESSLSRSGTGIGSEKLQSQVLHQLDYVIGQLKSLENRISL